MIRSRAWSFDRYGDLEVLSVRELPLAEPARPGFGEVLVRVRAAALNPKDSFVRKGRFRALSGRRFPKRVGVDFAGEVVSGVGFARGDRVYGALEEVTYLRGTVAEHIVARAREVARMPASLSFEEAVAIDGCVLGCVAACLEQRGLAPTLHIQLADAGVRNGPEATSIPRRPTACTKSCATECARWPAALNSEAHRTAIPTSHGR
jgi:NADPH:quinone reductase-like Zn-dependent oxidoreductase